MESIAHRTCFSERWWGSSHWRFYRTRLPYWAHSSHWLRGTEFAQSWRCTVSVPKHVLPATENIPSSSFDGAEYEKKDGPRAGSAGLSRRGLVTTDDLSRRRLCVAFAGGTAGAPRRSPHAVNGATCKDSQGLDGFLAWDTPDAHRHGPNSGYYWRGSALVD
jgi:hypothetical protein